jgi:hypothetical protein
MCQRNVIPSFHQLDLSGLCDLHGFSLYPTFCVADGAGQPEAIFERPDGKACHRETEMGYGIQRYAFRES